MRTTILGEKAKVVFRGKQIKLDENVRLEDREVIVV